MLNKKTGLLALLVGLTAGEVMAGTLTNYTTGDVLLCFRNTSGRDLVVDVGSYTSLTAGTPNQRISIPQYSASQLTTLAPNGLGGLNGLFLSSFAWLDDGTLFVTKKRVDLNTQSVTPSAANAGLQASASALMATIPVGTKDQYSNGGALNSTVIAVNEPETAAAYSKGKSYKNALFGTGTAPNFQGLLPSGDPEVATPGDFDTSGTVVRNDLYQIPPGSGQAGVTYLGYFELNPSGVMTFVAKPSTTPVFESISRAGSDSIIAYTAGQYGTYTLRGTNNLANAGAVTNWPAIATLTSGDTSIHTVTNTTTQANMFYSITAQ